MASQTICRPHHGNLCRLRMGAAARDGKHATDRKRLDGHLHRPAGDCGGLAATKLRVMQARPDSQTRGLRGAEGRI
jgi:hypothetical protein